MKIEWQNQVFRKGFGETYQSGIQLPVCFFDHTEERRAGRAPPLYHPHKDRKRERIYLKGHPTHTTLKITWQRLFDSRAQRRQLRQSHTSAFHVQIPDFALQRVVSHTLFSERREAAEHLFYCNSSEDHTGQLGFVFARNSLNLVSLLLLASGKA